MAFDERDSSDATTGPRHNTDNTFCNYSGTVNTDSTLNQYLNGQWLASTGLSNYIENHDFNVGGVYYYIGYAGGDKGIVREKEEENSYTWNGKVGLLNINEYAESSINSECTSVYSGFYYNTKPCKVDNYNYKSGYNQWSLSPNSTYRYHVWYVTSTGSIYGTYAYNALGIRPAFYLKSEISLIGVGTTISPYEIENM